MERREDMDSSDSYLTNNYDLKSNSTEEKKNVEESKTESKTESKNESQDESKTDSEDEEDSITSKSHPSGEGMHQDNISNGIRKPPLHKEALFYYHSNSEEFKFIDLSDVNVSDACSEPGENREPGYYGYYTDHPPSDSVELSNKDSKPATDEMPRMEKLSIVNKVQPNSLDLYHPKLADYKENVNRIDGIEEIKESEEVKISQRNEEVKESQSNKEIKENHSNDEQKFDDNNEKINIKNDKEIIDDEINDLEEMIPNEHLNKRNDIINRQIIRRAMINNDIDNSIFISLNDFSDYGSREATGYYRNVNYTNQSNFVSMVSSELNNEEDENMDVSHKLPLPYTKEYKSIHSAIRDLYPIRFYIQTIGRTEGWYAGCERYELYWFIFYLNLANKGDRKVILNSHKLKRLPNIRQLWINNIEEEGDRNIQDFLLNVAPLTLEEFGFEGRRINVSFYLEGLHAVLKSTTRLVHFSRCNFSSSELQSIFIAAKHIKQLEFFECKLDVAVEFDISQEKFNIKILWLSNCFYESEWQNNPQGVIILAKAVANSSLKHSLKTIDISDTRKGIRYEWAEETLKKFLRDMTYKKYFG